MAKIIWDDSYSVGIVKIDQQHQQLIDIINRLEDEKRSGGVILSVISDLSHYVKEHFSYEESLMEQAGYADLQEHKQSHKEFRQWLDSVKIAYSSGYAESYDIADSVQSYLQDWLLKHIMVSDMAYSEQVINKSNPDA